MPIAISIKDLAQTIIERLQNKYGIPLPSNIEIPSFEWIRLQFWPKSEQLSNRYTGRFHIRYAVQSLEYLQYQWQGLTAAEVILGYPARIF